MGTRINGGNEKTKISFETLFLVPKCPQPKWKKGGGSADSKKNYAYGSLLFNVFSSSEEASSSFLGVHRGTVDSSSGM